MREARYKLNALRGGAFFKELHFSPDNRHPLPDGILLQFFKKRCISHIQ